MANYLIIIKYATLFFPLIAFLFTIPFVLLEYHRYGSISFLKSVITYLFVFYLICAYFLVVLPLPKISEVAKMTAPRTQLIPFCFVVDFIKHSSLDISNTHTYLMAIKESYFYVPAFNIILTVPFGMFLRYYFKCSMKKTIFYGFLLSLFFEITQLTGLYFIYPRGYRLFDVDDLLLNTFGGFLGFLLMKPFTYVIPNMDMINTKAKERGKIISGLRGTIAFLLDIFILSLIELIVHLFIHNCSYFYLVIIIAYYFLIPLLLNHSTLGQKFLNIQILDYSNKKNIIRLFLRKIVFVIIYIGIPYYTCNLIFGALLDNISEYARLMVLVISFLIYFISMMKYLFTNKDMLYEKISKTKLVSTIE